MCKSISIHHKPPTTTQPYNTTPSYHSLAWAVLPWGGWRYLTGLAALPLLLATVFTLFLPESPRWLLEQGRAAEAWEALRRAARWNGRRAEEWGERKRGEGKALVLFRPHHRPESRGGGGGGNGGPGGGEVDSHGSSYSSSHSRHDPAASPSPSPSPSLSFPHTLVRLLSPALRTTTLCLWVVWFAFGLAYYGIVLYAAALFSTSTSSTSTG